jgi:hypothetical protein
MHVKHHRVLLVSLCLAFGFGLLGVSAPASAADKKKAWASKKHHKTHHKSSKPKPASAGAASTKSGGAAPAEESDDDEGEETAEDQQKAPKTDDAKAKPAKSNGDDGEREASRDSDDKSSGGDDDGDSSVVRRKAKRPVMEEGGTAPIAFELVAGPSAVHRSFDFNDPLSDHVSTATKPYGYRLPAGPVPFVNLGLYPAAFATRGLAASFGIVGHYEKLIGTKTEGGTFSTLGQQYEVGLRGRLPLGENEVGLTASYGKHSFHVTETDPGPGMGAVPNVDYTVPNVDYTFVGVGADARVRLRPVEIGLHVGTRFVTDTGALGQTWFTSTKANSINGGLSVAYSLTPLFSVVAGGEFLRYGFNFNPVIQGNPVVAGGAVDQYISGYLALRVSLSGG